MMPLEGLDLAQILAGILQFAATAIGNLNDQYYELLHKIAKFLAPLATLAAGVFAIRQKILYAERNMHLRLSEYLRREDARLAESRKYLDDSLVRPGPGKGLDEPIFVKQTLHPNLRAMRWGRIRFRRLNWSLEARTVDEVDDLIGELRSQLDLWEKQKGDFQGRKLRAHLIKGAIEASRAGKKRARGGDDREENLRALEEFQAAYAMDPDDLQALEYVGHQRTRLSDIEGALEEFKKLCEIAEKQGDDLARSRGLKFTAQIKETIGTPTALKEAKAHLMQALLVLPESERGGLEEAELHEVLGYVRIKHSTLPSALSALTDAERIYHANLKQAEAISGLTRVRGKMEEIRLQPDANTLELNRVSEAN